MSTKMKLGKPYYISLFYLCLLFVGSIVFFKERMLFIDPAFITFEIINTKQFVFSEHRYGAFITQMFPLVGSLINLPLPAILILYSTSFYLFYLFVVVACGVTLKQKKWAILFVFYLTFLVSDVYFWPNNEVHVAVGWMILFLSLYDHTIEKNLTIPKTLHFLMVGILFLSIISHLLVVVPFIFLWLYRILGKPKNKNTLKIFTYYSITIALFIIIRICLSYDSWYDGAKLEGIKQVNAGKFFHAFANGQSSSMFSLLITKYWPFVIIFLAGLFSLAYKRKYRLLALTILSALLYYALIVITHSVEITPDNLFYFESQWMGITLIACTPFVFEATKLITKKHVLSIVFTLIFVLKIPQLKTSLDKFSTRYENLNALVEHASSIDAPKSYLIQSPKLQNQLLETWGLPVESMLLSSLQHEKTITIKVFKANARVSESTDSIYTAFKFLPISDLNKDYFSMPDNSPYLPLSVLQHNSN